MRWTAALGVAVALALTLAIVVWPDAGPSSAENDPSVVAGREHVADLSASTTADVAATTTTAPSPTPTPTNATPTIAPRPSTARSSSPAATSPGPTTAPSTTTSPATPSPNDVAPTATSAPTATTAATPETVAPREPVRCVVGAPGAGGGTDLATGFSPGYPYDEDPTRYQTRPMPGYPELGDLAAAGAGCDQIVVHAFSEGARRAKEWYCAGETLDGRIVGYVLDDPNYFPDVGQPCTPGAGVRVVLYGTRLAPTDSRWTVDYFLLHTGFGNCMDKTSARLGTPVVVSPRYFHEPYTHPSPPQIANDAAHGGWFR